MTSPVDPRMLAMLSSGQQPQGQGAPPSPPAAGMGMGGYPTLPPAAGGQPSPAMGGGNPTDQVIWQAFPSTDPNAVGQLLQGVSQGGPQGMMEVLPHLQAIMQQDEDALYQRQQATLRMVLDQLVGPSPDQAQAPAAGPGVTGPGYQ
jgi:hypothetical protein